MSFVVKETLSTHLREGASVDDGQFDGLIEHLLTHCKICLEQITYFNCSCCGWVLCVQVLLRLQRQHYSRYQLEVQRERVDENLADLGASIFLSLWHGARSALDVRL